jgi:hypothetical protein
LKIRPSNLDEGESRCAIKVREFVKRRWRIFRWRCVLYRGNRRAVSEGSEYDVRGTGDYRVRRCDLPIRTHVRGATSDEHLSPLRDVTLPIEVRCALPSCRIAIVDAIVDWIRVVLI